jgi:hypothetical protein
LTSAVIVNSDYCRKRKLSIDSWWIKINFKIGISDHA